MRNNPDLLQVAEVENSDADLTSDASKINEESANIKISMKEEQKSVEYQEILKIDVGNIAKNQKNMETNI